MLKNDKNIAKYQLEYLFYFFCRIFIMKTQKRKDWSPKKRVTAITLRKEGYSYRAVADKIGCGVTASGVRKLCKRYEDTGSVETQAGRGRHKATTEITDRRIVRLSLSDRTLTANKISKRWMLEFQYRTELSVGDWLVQG